MRANWALQLKVKVKLSFQILVFPLLNIISSFTGIENSELLKSLTMDTMSDDSSSLRP